MYVCNPNGKNVTQQIGSRRASEVIESQRIKAGAFLSLGEAGVKEATDNPEPSLPLPAIHTKPCPQTVFVHEKHGWTRSFKGAKF